jgi:hypothetical protein
MLIDGSAYCMHNRAKDVHCIFTSQAQHMNLKHVAGCTEHDPNIQHRPQDEAECLVLRNGHKFIAARTKHTGRPSVNTSRIPAITSTSTLDTSTFITSCAGPSGLLRHISSFSSLPPARPSCSPKGARILTLSTSTSTDTTRHYSCPRTLLRRRDLN